MTTASFSDFADFSESRPWHMDALPALVFVLTAAALLWLVGVREESASPLSHDPTTAIVAPAETAPSLDSQRQALAIISGE